MGEAAEKYPGQSLNRQTPKGKKMEDKKQPGAQMRFTEEEVKIIRDTFKDNEKLLKLLRKVFLPEIDPDAPLGQIIDLWMTVPLKEMSSEDARINILARNSLIMHLEQQLIQLKILSEIGEENVAEFLEKKKKDSMK